MDHPRLRRNSSVTPGRTEKTISRRSDAGLQTKGDALKVVQAPPSPNHIPMSRTASPRLPAPSIESIADSQPTSSSAVPQAPLKPSVPATSNHPTPNPDLSALYLADITLYVAASELRQIVLQDHPEDHSARSKLIKTTNNESEGLARTLAREETVWFLSSIVHAACRCLSPSRPGTTTPTTREGADSSEAQQRIGVVHRAREVLLEILVLDRSKSPNLGSNPGSNSSSSRISVGEGWYRGTGVVGARDGFWCGGSCE